MKTAEEREDKKIVIDGQTFIAEKLHPNFRGVYDCTCGECALGEHCYPDDEIGWYKNCMKVKCIGHDRDEGNFNIWSKVERL